MPKVLRIINRFNLGGPTFNVAYLTRYLEGYETLLVGGAKDESEDSSEFILENLGLKPFVINEMKRKIDPALDIAAYKKIKTLIKEFNPDIVHTHASKAGTLGRLAAINLKVPVILHTFHGHVFHSYFGKLSTTFYKNIERYLASKSTAIIAISEKQKHELCQLHKIAPEDKFRVIPLGFDLAKFQENTGEKRLAFRNQYHLHEDTLAVGIIGRLVPVKNHELFLTVAKAVLQTTSKKVRFFIIGDGEQREALFETCRNLSLPFTYMPESPDQSEIVFTSWIKDVDRVLAGLDIVALTSFNEGTPVSLIEAQAANKPIVTTDVGGIENVVIPGKTALLAENNNMAQFTDQLNAVINDENLRWELSKGGWEHVKNTFHYTRLVSDVKNLYDELLR